ncbi:MAG: AMP-binding protein [Acidobacteriota bacterium]
MLTLELERHRERPFLCLDEDSDHPAPCLSFGELLTAVERLRQRWAGLSRRSVALRLPWPPPAATIAALLALADLEADAFLVDTELPEDLVRDLLLRHDVDDLVDDELRVLPLLGAGAHRPQDVTPRVTLLTCGASGTPKAVEHTWRSLTAGIPVQERLLQSRWLLTDSLSRYGGLQVLLTCLLNGAELVVPQQVTATSVLDTCRRQAVSHAYGTPSFWRDLLASTSPQARSELRLRQITLGGEIVDQPLLEALSESFPEAHITHSFARSESGNAEESAPSLDIDPALDRARAIA